MANKPTIEDTSYRLFTELQRINLLITEHKLQKIIAPTPADVLYNYIKATLNDR